MEYSRMLYLQEGQDPDSHCKQNARKIPEGPGSP